MYITYLTDITLVPTMVEEEEDDDEQDSLLSRLRHPDSGERPSVCTQLVTYMGTPKSLMTSGK